MSDLKATLDALSEAATPGEWRVVTPPADWDKGGIWLSADPKYEYASEIVGMHCCCCGEGGFADGDDAIFVTRLVNAFRTGQLIVKPERDVVDLSAQAERIAFLQTLAEDMGTLAQAHRDATVKAEARIAQLEAQLAEQPGMIAGWLRKVAEQFPTHELLYFIGPAWTDDGAALAQRFAQAIENGDWRND